MNLIDWLKTNVGTEQGSFVSAKEMYCLYISDTERTAQVSEDLFFKEIEPIMFGLNMKPGKVRGRRAGRGYEGQRLLGSTFPRRATTPIPQRGTGDF